MENEALNKKAWQSWEDDQKTNPSPVNPQAYTYGYKAGFKAALGYTLQSAVQSGSDEIEKLKKEYRELLERLDDYFDNYADADYIQEQYSPNPEMVFLSEIRQLLNK